MNSVPTFVIEEHNEAFYIWNYCIAKGMMPANGNVLLHVDEHADMGVPKFNSSINELTTDPEEVLKFVQDEIGIGSFIVPSIYLGLFREISWIKVDQKVRSNRLYVRSYNAEGMRLLIGPATKELIKASEQDKDVKFFQYNLGTADNVQGDPNVVLDIDLDYFSCTGNPIELQDITIEITENEYENFRNDPYHKVRFLGFKPAVKQRNNKCYLTLNDYKHIYPNLHPFTLKVEASIVENRIDELVNNLAKEQVNPAIITICRSRFSGFTPLDQWSEIEALLLEKLALIYDLKLYQLKQLINSSAAVV